MPPNNFASDSFFVDSTHVFVVDYNSRLLHCALPCSPILKYSIMKCTNKYHISLVVHEDHLFLVEYWHYFTCLFLLCQMCLYC